MSEQPMLGKPASELVASFGDPAYLVRGQGSQPDLWVYGDGRSVVTTYQVMTDHVEAINVINIHSSNYDQINTLENELDSYRADELGMRPIAAGPPGKQGAFEASDKDFYFQIGHYTYDPFGGMTFDFGPPADPPSYRTYKTWISKDGHGKVPEIFWMNN